MVQVVILGLGKDDVGERARRDEMRSVCIVTQVYGLIWVSSS